MSTNEKTQENTREIVADRTRFDPEDLRSVASMADAVRLIQEKMGGQPLYDASTEIGDGFTMLDDKNALVNVPFVLVQWSWATGDFGAMYLIARLVTEDGNKYVVTDGSTGLAEQVRSFEQRTGATGGLLAPRGLRRSEYDTEINGETVHGVTFYLNV